MSLSSLHRKVKALTGETPARLIWNMRLKKAAALLTSSTRRITEIAFEVGYSNSNHFGRQFKQRYGMTPREYRTTAASSDTP
jgi:AraC-like DNA-binding protein